ncbi:MAG: ATP-binding cassette domain-containing protein [Propionibacteriaceae bacterium]|nr:ATP-binding cassette domain-containing protein [Propionibacteriaceae bacterium]
MIEFHDVHRSRGPRRILDGISFRAAPGRITGFVGPNGAGKTSSLRILLALDRGHTGTATVCGQHYATLKHPLTVVGASLGGSGAHPARRAVAHLRWVAASNSIPQSRVAQVLDEVGLGRAARQRVRTYSLGMAQRLGIAAALLGEPEVLVLDEPINGLDPEGIRWLRQLLRRHAACGGTVLLSSHVMTELAEVADDVVVIAGGTIRATGTLAEVTAGHTSLEEAYFALTAGVPR